MKTVQRRDPDALRADLADSGYGSLLHSWGSDTVLIPGLTGLETSIESTTSDGLINPQGSIDGSRGGTDLSDSSLQQVAYQPPDAALHTSDAGTALRVPVIVKPELPEPPDAQQQ